MPSYEGRSQATGGGASPLSDVSFSTTGFRGTSASGGPTSGPTPAEDRFAKAVISALQENATEIRVYKDGRPIGSYINPDQQNDLTCDIASCTKSLTALAIFKAMELSLLKLDDRVATYVDLKAWPHFKFSPYSNITIRHLLTHTSGYPGNDFFKPFDPKGIIGDNQFALNGNFPFNLRASFWPLIGQPGKHNDYSNPAVQVLCEVLGGALKKADLPEKRVEDFIRVWIFEPLGMHGTTLSMVEDTPKVFGGVKATAELLARPGFMILGEGTVDGIQVLKPETVDAMIATPTNIPAAAPYLGHLWWKDSHARSLLAVGDRANILKVFPDEGIVVSRTQKKVFPALKNETDDDYKKRIGDWYKGQKQGVLAAINAYRSEVPSAEPHALTKHIPEPKTDPAPES